MRAVLAGFARNQAKREKIQRALERRYPHLKGRTAANTDVIAAVRNSIRKARVEEEVEKRVAAQAAADRPWSEKQVCRFVERSRATIRRWVQHNGFPKPRQIGPNSVAWSEREVREWWERKKALRRGE